MNRVNIMGIGFDPVNEQEALDRVVAFLRLDKTSLVVTPNPEMINEAMQNSELHSVLNSADLVLPDGIGVIYAAKILGKPLNTRVTGVDLMEKVLSYLAKTEKTFFLLGAKEGYAELAANNIELTNKGLRCVGFHHGYFDEKDESKIINMINDSRPHVLFIGLGSPRQEIWANEHKKILNTKVCMCVGGAIDVYAGKVSRAPKWVSRIGFEWLYRTIKQPSRLSRIAKLPGFMLKVVRSKKMR